MISEQHNSMMKFPCSFPLKVIGKQDEDFEMMIIPVIRRHVPHLANDSIVRQASGEGKYPSLTVTFVAEGRGQLEGLYDELRGLQCVLMVL